MAHLPSFGRVFPACVPLTVLVTPIFSRAHGLSVSDVEDTFDIVTDELVVIGHTGVTGSTGSGEVVAEPTC